MDGIKPINNIFSQPVSPRIGKQGTPAVKHTPKAPETQGINYGNTWVGFSRKMLANENSPFNNTGAFYSQSQLGRNFENKPSGTRLRISA